jgi:hypothetical protein
MVFSATFNNISVISLAVSFIGGGNRRKSQSCRKSQKLKVDQMIIFNVKG